MRSRLNGPYRLPLSADHVLGDDGRNHMTDMAVVIVNYNTRDHLQACLEAIRSNEASDPEQLTLSQRVRGSSPWRLTTDQQKPT
jgi:hypothetical protein